MIDLLIDNIYKGVMVIGEFSTQKASELTYELIGKAYDLAKILEVEVSVILLGDVVNTYCEQCISYGADIVYKVDQKRFEIINETYYTEAYYQIIRNYKPEILLIPSNIQFKSIGARLAAKLNTGLTADCIELWINDLDRNLLQKRPAREGTVFATITCPSKRPQMVTVKKGVMEKKEKDTTRKGVVVIPEVSINSENRIKIIESKKIKDDGSDNFESDIVIAIGRGIGGKENLKKIKKIVNLLNAKLVGTRAVVDLGWIDSKYQVGLSGQSVKCKTYLALGISGAIQHTVALHNVERIIAINKDANAPIFKIATYGIVVDINKILPLISSYLLQCEL